MRKNILGVGLGSLLALNIATSDAKTIDDYMDCIRNEKNSYQTFFNDSPVVTEFHIIFKTDQYAKKEALSLIDELGYDFIMTNEDTKIIAKLYNLNYEKAKNLFDTLSKCLDGSRIMFGFSYNPNK